MSFVLPTYYYLLIIEFYLKYCKVPANPVPTVLSYKKLTYSLILYNYYGLISLNDYGRAYFYYFLTNLSDGNFINIADVVPDCIPFISKSFLTYFLSSPV